MPDTASDTPLYRRVHEDRRTVTLTLTAPAIQLHMLYHELLARQKHVARRDERRPAPLPPGVTSYDALRAARLGDLAAALREQLPPVEGSRLNESALLPRAAEV